jgi:hypothetical protein
LEIFSLRKIGRICPRGCGPGPPASAHGSTDFLKCQSLAFRSTARIEPSEPISRLLISTVHHQSDGRGGWLRPGPAWARAHGGASWPSMMAPWSSSFLRLRWLAMVRRLGRCLAMVKAASSEASAPRACAKASSSSLLASRPTNCSERRWKTRTWWLPRVRQVLDLRLKIRTICGAIYRGF